MDDTDGGVTAQLADPPTIQDGQVAATGELEATLAGLLADLMGAEDVSAGSHFFDDLGADSMTMTRFCARVRNRADLPAVSMKDIYRYPSIAALTAALSAALTEAVSAAGDTMVVSPATAPIGPRIGEVTPVHTLRYLLCGALQLLSILGLTYLGAVIISWGYRWILTGPTLVYVSLGSVRVGSASFAGSTVLNTYVRSVVFSGASFVGWCLLPILVKWVLVGRWKPARIRLWTLSYARFWFVRVLIRSSPLVLFVGSPLYVVYLRALGATIGRGVVIFSPTVPVCTDLLTIGAGTVIRKGSSFTCYRAHRGEIQTGGVTLGADVVVAESTVLDIDTAMGSRAQLGHASSLHSGQVVPEGQRWHGSPAQRGEASFLAVEPTGCGLPRRIVYSLAQLLGVALALPLAIGTGVLLLAAGSQLSRNPRFAALIGSAPLALSSTTFYRNALTVVAVLLVAVVVLGLVFLLIVPRALNLAITPNKVYPLYGFHYLVHRTITLITNIPFYTYLFGDSSYIVHYLGWLGYHLSPVVQTGTNFGLESVHDTPYLSSVGSGTMVADGLSINNADYSNTSFRLSRVCIGSHNFLGNYITYPSRGKTGQNCLLATKVAIPIDGDIREGVGLLGSPCFEIPRSVQRDSRFNYLAEGDELRRRLRAKNRHNALTMVLYLLTRWIYVSGLTLLASGVLALYTRFGAPVIALALVATLLFTTIYFVVVERVAGGFRAMRPLFCSIYERSFWRHERFWKLSATNLAMFNGTPFKNVIWRMLGVRIGHRVFDDGCVIPEKRLVSIGDHATLNAASKIWCHSQEDGTFKSDYIVIGSSVTLGVGAFVHYGVGMGTAAVLEADAFLMKGEQVSADTRWIGNPATEQRRSPTTPTTTISTTTQGRPAQALNAAALMSGPAPVRRAPRPVPAGQVASPTASVSPTATSQRVEAGHTAQRNLAPGVAAAPGDVPGRRAPRPVPAGQAPPVPAMSSAPTADHVKMAAQSQSLAASCELADSVRPRVRGELPGPLSARQLAPRASGEPQTMMRSRGLPIVVAEAAGSFLRDLDHNIFIDFWTGGGSLALGHHHPELAAERVARLGQRARDEGVSTALRVVSDAQLAMLPESMRDRMRIEFCAPHAASAMHAALSLCRTVTGRVDSVPFPANVPTQDQPRRPVQGKASGEPAADAPAGPALAPFTCCSRCRGQLGSYSSQRPCVSALESLLRHGDDHLYHLGDGGGVARLPAAVVISVMQGTGGVAPAHRECVRQARVLTRSWGIPLVADEIRTGAGRTGTWFAFEHYDIEPDVIVSANSFSGIDHPAAMVLHNLHPPPPPDTAGGSVVSDDPLAFLAEAALVDIVGREDLLHNARMRGEQLGNRLAGLRHHPCVHDVTGRGLMWGVEMAAPGDGRSAPAIAAEVRARAMAAGLILELGGPANTVVLILPSLTVRAEVVDIASSILVHAIEAAFLDSGNTTDPIAHDPSIRQLHRDKGDT